MQRPHGAPRPSLLAPVALSAAEAADILLAPHVHFCAPAAAASDTDDDEAAPAQEERSQRRRRRRHSDDRDGSRRRPSTSPCVERRFAGAALGFGLFATRALEAGAPLFRELPLAALPCPDTATTACPRCVWCGEWVGALLRSAPRPHVRRRVADDDDAAAAAPRACRQACPQPAAQSQAAEDAPAGARWRCPGRCGVAFCSRACGLSAWLRFHWAECEGGASPAVASGAAVPDATTSVTRRGWLRFRAHCTRSGWVSALVCSIGAHGARF